MESSFTGVRGGATGGLDITEGVTQEVQRGGCFCTKVGWFTHTSNLRNPQHHRTSKVWRGMSHEFGGDASRSHKSPCIEKQFSSASVPTMSQLQHSVPSQLYQGSSFSRTQTCIETPSFNLECGAFTRQLLHPKHSHLSLTHTLEVR